jgi:hypothetical protein
MGSRIHHGSNERQKGDQEFDHVGVRSGVGIKPKTKLVTTPFGNHHLVDWRVFPHYDEDKKDYENLAEDPKFKKVVKNTYCFYFKSTGLLRREAESDLNGGKRLCDLGREKRFPRDPIPDI